MSYKTESFFTELNYCEKNPDTCKNSGKCQSLESGDGHFRCNCPPGISGKHCENLPDSMTTTPATDNETAVSEGSVSEVSMGETVEETATVDSDESTTAPDNNENETE